MNISRLPDPATCVEADAVHQAWSNFERSVKNAHQKRSAGTRIIRAADLDIDLSLQHNSQEMVDASVALLEAHHFHTMRQRLFRGEHVNWTEGRPALHTALRQSPAPDNVTEQIAESLASMKAFVDQCNARNKFRNIV